MAKETLRAALVAGDGLTTWTAASPLMYADGAGLPTVYEVTASGGPLPFTVVLTVEGISGYPDCRGIRIEPQPDEPSLTNMTLRLPIARILRQSAQQVVGRRTSVGIVEGEWQAHAEQAPGRRLRVDDERLLQAADAWRSVKGLPGALEQMATRLHVSRSQADRLRTAAREAGFLQPDEVRVRQRRNSQPKEQG